MISLNDLNQQELERVTCEMYGTSFNDLYVHEQMKVEEYAVARRYGASTSVLDTILTKQPNTVRPKIELGADIAYNGLLGTSIDYTSWFAPITKPTFVWNKQKHRWFKKSSILCKGFRSLRVARDYGKWG